MNHLRNVLGKAVLITATFFFGPLFLQAETSGGWVKHPENPVLGGEEIGVCFDVALLEEDGVYRLWFSWRSKGSIGYAESQNGVDWSEPIVVLEPAGDWEIMVNRPGVVFHDGLYYLWYTGQTKTNSCIGCATSSDGIHWTRVQNGPVLVPEEPWEKVAVMCPHVLWNAAMKRFDMWYSGGEQNEPNAIGFAVSSDGVHWTRHRANPIFSADPESVWERHKVTAAQIFPHGGWYYMFYIGFESEPLARIGVARSRNGIDGWRRHPANPIISPDPEAWDADACYKPFVLYDEKNQTWRLWYNGRSGHIEQIGLATRHGEDLGFPPEESDAKKNVQ